MTPQSDAKPSGPCNVDDPYQENGGDKNYFRSRKEDRKDLEQKHKHRMNWAKFCIYTIVPIIFAIGGVILSIYTEVPELRSAGIAICSSVIGAFIQLTRLSNKESEPPTSESN